MHASFLVSLRRSMLQKCSELWHSNTDCAARLKHTTGLVDQVCACMCIFVSDRFCSKGDDRVNLSRWAAEEAFSSMGLRDPRELVQSI